jgi:hypothetical protein
MHHFTGIGGERIRVSAAVEMLGDGHRATRSKAASSRRRRHK